MRQRVSRTATVVALWRARESARPVSTRLFEDPFAEAFVGWRLRCALQLSRLPLVGAALPWSLVDGHWGGSRGTVSVRTRYIDDALCAALRHGVEQVVILGAGFDSRAYRIAGIARARVFEVDHPVTQAKKRDRVVRRLGTMPSHVTLVPLDLATDMLDTAMAAASYRTDVRTFFICEGVTHYLSASAVEMLLRFVAQSAGGSRIVFTYIHRAILDGSVRFAGADTTLTTVSRGGEPYVFGFEPVELPQYLAARGLALIEDVGADTYRDRYLTPLGRGREPLSDFQRAALAEITGGRSTSLS
jgi:methyltransferase (TIGR00027 family)